MPGRGNVVGYNATGIDIDNGGQNNLIQGNFVGAGADGTTPVGNLVHGIDVRSSNGFMAPLGPPQANEPGVSNNLIGGTLAGGGNLIEFNGQAGVAVFGNPVSASGQPNVGNAIEGNSVFENGRNFQGASSKPLPLLGIDLTNGSTYPRDDGITANDSNGHGAPNDPNNFQNFPVLSTATRSSSMTTINGTLSAAANTTYRVEFFFNDPDPLGLPGEGQQFIGFTNVMTDSGGSATIAATLPSVGNTGQVITATATDPLGNTSEFSASIPAPLPSFIVTNINDTGDGSLRQVLTDANAFPGVQTITFNIPGSGPHEIVPSTQLPTITQPVVIDGYSQPGSSVNTQAHSDDAVITIGLSGVGNNIDRGLDFGTGSGGSSVRGLAFTGFQESAINVTSDGNTFAGNFIGAGLDGKGISPFNGLSLSASSNNVVGGSAPADRNVIDGNVHDGVFVAGTGGTSTSDNNVIRGNFIGLNAANTAGKVNGIGVFVSLAHGTVIGGAGPGEGNVIDANVFAGIALDLAATDSLILGNLIGADANGVAGDVSLSNREGIGFTSGATNNIVGGSDPGDANVIIKSFLSGIDIDGCNANWIMGNRIGVDLNGNAAGNGGRGILIQPDINTAAGSVNNIIGGSVPAAGNIIANNHDAGVLIITSSPASPSAGNAMRFNSIYSNGQLGIDLSAGSIEDGVTFNDPGDTDGGSNHLQNFPALTNAISNNGVTTITGTIATNASQNYYLDFYSNAEKEPNGFIEGRSYLGTIQVTTDAAGNASFSAALPVSVANGTLITATATSTALLPAGDTSEFAPPVQTTAPLPPTPPTISIGDVSQNEGNSGTTAFNFTVTRSGDTSGTSIVSFTTADGSATSPGDYTAASGLVTFTAGQTTQTITVNVKGDTSVESDETFVVNLAPASNATIADGQGTGTIKNDDSCAAATEQ